jgi:signal transduction histidine kinase
VSTAGDQRLPRLLPDIGLAALIGLFSYAFARLSAQFDSSAEYGGPPWHHRGRFGPPSGPIGHQPEMIGEPYTWIALGWVVLVALGVALRRVRPRTAYLITVVGATGYLASGLPFGPVLAGPAVGLITLATRMAPRRWAPWTALLIPVVWAGFVNQDYLGLTDPSLYSAIVLLGAVMIMPALFATLRRNRIDASRRTRELDLRRAAYQERLRITRDVHDLIGHSLSVINMQAGVALYVLDKSDSGSTNVAPDADGSDLGKIEDSLRAIRSTSKNALEELRATLAVFRGETGETRAPVGGMARLPELIDSFRAAGRRVELIMEDTVRLPGPIDAACYRIIQEALTNVARHTKDATATVRITQDTDTVMVSVTDDGPPTRIPDDHDGNGLLGMAERAESVGGTLRAAPVPGGGFAVLAAFRLPHLSDLPETRSAP